MRMRGIVVSVLVCVAVAGCGDTTSGGGAKPFTLLVGPTRWDATAPAWFQDGTLHVGDRSVELGDGVEQFVLGATGAYWVRGAELMFTSAEGRTQKVATPGQSELAVSADRSVLATVDQSRGPTDEYGTHVLQAAVFDTRTGEQLYRTPDEEPDDGADLADLYEETTPLLHGVSTDRLFFDNATIDLHDGSRNPTTADSEGVGVYAGMDQTLFPDGYSVAIRGEGRRRELADSEVWGVGRLSPDRSTIFDVSMWPTPAVVYDAETGRQRRLDAPWDHFTLVAWSDEDTFFGVAQRIDEDNVDNVLRAQQVVSCELRTLACTPVSPVIPTQVDQGGGPTFLVEATGAHL